MQKYRWMPQVHSQLDEESREHQENTDKLLTIILAIPSSWQGELILGCGHGGQITAHAHDVDNLQGIFEGIFGSPVCRHIRSMQNIDQSFLKQHEGALAKLPGSTEVPVKYHLKVFISHKGLSVHSGHYVAHIHVEAAGDCDEGWVLFNDEKVVKADRESVRELKSLGVESTCTPLSESIRPTLQKNECRRVTRKISVMQSPDSRNEYLVTRAQSKPETGKKKHERRPEATSTKPQTEISPSGVHSGGPRIQDSQSRSTTELKRTSTSRDVQNWYRTAESEVSNSGPTAVERMGSSMLTSAGTRELGGVEPPAMSESQEEHKEGALERDWRPTGR
ncbi:hypothetical protein DFP72DRAFT_856734 [Ephemerocybe angulata]|uniref:USP domain-containing protein n=1 Tax=Ephemerocybe angulata TaxID=980116 RepID=A0A8H6LV97_9AGAR|nr:hypothetical protein DFP72DRAFT_856734 [Tulosesus angulatus]